MTMISTDFKKGEDNIKYSCFYDTKPALEIIARKLEAHMSLLDDQKL